MDLLYILGTGSQWADNELRYSLRAAVRHLPVERVCVVGERPPWLTGVEHIPALDRTPDLKLLNSIHKLSLAVASGVLGERFVLMNDDFFVLRDRTDLPPAHKGPLADSLRFHPTGTGYYHEAIAGTLDRLRAMGIDNPLDYGLHIPMEIETAKLVEVLHGLPGWPGGYLLRTVYGNRWQIGGEQRQDCKVRGGWRPDLVGGDFLSTDDLVVRDLSFRKWLQTRWPSPCRFEALP